jgi:hypothetical protein
MHLYDYKTSHVFTPFSSSLLPLTPRIINSANNKLITILSI